MLTQNEKAKGQLFNIACGNNFSVNFLYNAIAAYLNSDHKCIHRDARAGDIRNSLADISKAEALLEYDPKFDFKKGLDITVQFFVEKYNKQ
jgi:UDP-N-acetylglucosamine 4-epimerase